MIKLSYVSRLSILLFAAISASCDTTSESDHQQPDSDAVNITDNAGTNDEQNSGKAVSTKKHYELVTSETTKNLPGFLQHLRDLGLQDDDGYFLVEGDLLLTEEEIGIVEESVGR